MADLKVVTPTQNNGTQGPQGVINPTTVNVDENNARALELEKEIETTQLALSKKKYRIKTTTEVVNYLMEDFYPNVNWNGYECYAISETFNNMTKIVSKLKPSKTGKVGLSLTPDILQALFHFIKSHANTGITTAQSHRLLCEDFSVPMAELNQDHQALRDIAVEAEAAKHGITVEQYKAAAQQNAPQMPPTMPR